MNVISEVMTYCSTNFLHELAEVNKSFLMYNLYANDVIHSFHSKSDGIYDGNQVECLLLQRVRIGIVLGLLIISLILE